MMKELFTGLTAVNISPENALAIVEAFDDRFKGFEERFETKFTQLNVKIGVMEGKINFLIGLLVTVLLAALGAIAKQIF